MFIGEFGHRVDTKGSLIIPSKFRKFLGEEFIITKGLDGCLFAFPEEERAAVEEKLYSLPLIQKDARKFIRFFVAGATLCGPDKQGRVLLPVTLREFAGLDKEVVLAGMLNRVESWSKERWAENNAWDDRDNIAEQMLDLGLSI
jgi:MraZ protein